MVLPTDFINSLKNLEGFNEEAFLKAHQKPAPTSIRINPFKRTELKFKLVGKVPWANNAYYLKERPVFTADPLFHAGCYYVQEASSMFIEHALGQVVDFEMELAVLDLCAAPGGKSTILSSLLNKQSVLVANEVIKGRAEVLAYNLAKWGNANHIVTNSETSSFSKLKGVFDVVIVDAPCSGSGLFRKQQDAVEEWSLHAVENCATRQKSILHDALPCLKQNGYLVYSTCSYSSSENEEIVKWLVTEGLEIVPINTEKVWGVEDTGFGYRFYPHNLEGEGFFCCVLKQTRDQCSLGQNRKNGLKEATRLDLEVISDFVELGKEHKVINHNNEFKLLNVNALNFINSFKNFLYLKEVGTPIGEIKHEELIPHHYLSLSNHLKSGPFLLELNDSEVFKYLKKEAFVIPDHSKGLKCFTSKGFGIGWGKNLGSRINNYLPLNLQVFNKSLEALK